MAANGYGAWLGRAREHHVAGRIIDALLCYRRALRDEPRGVDARFHVAEIAWHTGQPAQAIEQWRALVADVPAHAASWHALADALAAGGDFAASRDAIDRVIALRSDDARASALATLLRHVSVDDANGDRGDDAQREQLRSALDAGPWPLRLLVAVAESGAERAESSADASIGSSAVDIASALARAALAAPVARGDEDALRRVAVALRAVGRHDVAAEIVARYVAASVALHRSHRPLQWPVRAAGALRVGLLAAAGDAQACRDTISRSFGDDVECIVVPPSLDTPDVVARALVARDLDVLIDTGGVDLPSAPLLALHPARNLWAIERERCRARDALFERRFDATDRDAWVDALRCARRDVANTPSAALTPRDLDERFQAAVLAHRQGDVQAARDAYASLLEIEPDHAPTLYLAGAAARDAGDAESALAHCREAVAVAPEYVDARVALVAALIDRRDADAAVDVAREGLSLEPASAPLQRALGQAELAADRADAAIAAFAGALAHDPTNGDAHYNLGVALQTAHQAGEAARAYQRALAFRPDLDAAHFNLGVVFEQQGRADAAIAAFSHVLQHAPSHVPAFKALADALLATGRVEAWYANFERFEKQAPAQVALAVNALEVSAYRGDFERVERYLDGLRHGRFTAERADEMLDALQQLVYLLHFFDVEADLIGRYARTHDALSQNMYGEPMPRGLERRPGRIRIGYLSGDFRNHVMGKMMYEALRHHDHERFEIFGYATTAARDAWTSSFEPLFTRFTCVDAQSDREAVAAIAADDLDVLVDLSTHTKGARPGILARKPARVQITHVASAGTLGMSAIDFKLTDRYADLAHDPAHQIEPLLAMSGCVYPYRHVEASPNAPFSRASLGIDKDAVVIAAFSTPLKLSQRCLALWRDVFARLPNARLAFSPVHPGLRPAFLRLAALAGVGAHRVVFVPQGRDDAENQARYRVVDFVLDPMPYGGVNGTLEALDMGVPVVTLIGRRHAERTSFSILSNLGVTDTIAQSGADYVAIAVRLATDAAFQRDVRQRIRDDIAHSALTDMVAHTRHLEDAYVQALEARAPEALMRGPR
jgi:predicted O-linked N-acetylglucosamine transferase (SPINDLY family)